MSESVVGTSREAAGAKDQKPSPARRIYQEEAESIQPSTNQHSTVI